MVAIRRQAFAEDISAANGGTHFSSTLADNRRTMFLIEPLSQSDRANFQLLLFRLTGTHSRVSLFAAPTFCRAKGNVILLADGFEDVTYRCKSCRSETKRTFKRCSGAWELVTLPSFFALCPEAKKKTATEAKQNQGLA